MNKEKIKDILGTIAGWLFLGFLVYLIFFTGDSDNTKKEREVYQKGDMSDKGGSPTLRVSPDYIPRYEDNPITTNDESNDQPVGFYGTDTMYAHNVSSGNSYNLDVDSNGEEVERIYFPKGGWVDIDYSECDAGYCYAVDENGNEWELEY